MKEQHEETEDSARYGRGSSRALQVLVYQAVKLAFCAQLAAMGPDPEHEKSGRTFRHQVHETS